MGFIVGFNIFDLFDSGNDYPISRDRYKDTLKNLVLLVNSVVQAHWKL